MKTRVRVSWEDLSKQGLVPSWWKETSPKYFEIEAEVIEEKCEHEWIDQSPQKYAGHISKCIKCGEWKNDKVREKKALLLAPALYQSWFNNKYQWAISRELFSSLLEATKRLTWLNEGNRCKNLNVIWPAKIDPETGMYRIEEGL